MEEEKTIRIDSEVADDIIIQNLGRFQDTLASYDIFRTDHVNMTRYENRGIATIPFVDQCMMEETMNILSELFNVHILYSYRKDGGRYHKILAYSMPYPDEMFIICLESMQYGVIEDFSVAFYTSLDIMLKQLLDSMDILNSKKVVSSERIRVLQQQSLTDLYAKFV